MEEKNKALEDLANIKGMMEQSTRFISLSGLSGVFAGIYAIIGALLIWKMVDLRVFAFAFDLNNLNVSDMQGGRSLGNILSVVSNEIADFAHGSKEKLHEALIRLGLISCMMLLLSFTTGIFLTVRKSRKVGQSFFGTSSQRLLANLLLPLIAGGVFILMLMYKGHFDLMAPCTLIFYGLALINASKYTLHDIKFLGIIEVVLGLTSVLFNNLELQLLLWAIGFGAFHILYGLIMHFKYERK